jgi:hypothetical protein
MASSPNLSVPHSQDNPAPASSKTSCEPLPGLQASPAVRVDSLTRFSAGILLGFSGAYVLRSPLTVGQITILAAFGILLLASAIIRRRLA